MAIVQISKIIQKQGNLADLPQLDVAEIGYATDSKRLFIGDEIPSDPDPTQLYNTEVLTQNSVDGTSIIYDPITGVISSVGGGGGGGGTVTSVGLSGGMTGLTVAGSPITTTGVMTLGGVLSVAHGGTGSNTSNGALISLLPSQVNNAGKYLTTDGSNVSWANVTGGTANAAGSNTQIQFNMGGQFAASDKLTYDPANDIFQVGSLTLTSYIESGNGQAMIVSANQSLTLQSLNQDIIVSLPTGNTHKIGISGPSASDYADNLATNDLVNKFYVDNAVANGTPNLFPPQAGNAGKYLMTDGLEVMWGPVGACNTDEYYQNVALLLSCSEAVGDTNLMDSSWWGEDKALPGQWEFSADRKKFGTTSLLVKEGIGPTWEDYRFTRHTNSGYTIEMWFRPETRSPTEQQAPNLFKLYDVATGDSIIEVSLFEDEAGLVIAFENDPGSLYSYSTGSEGWNHMAVVFQTNNNIDLYVNGTRLATRLAAAGIIAGALNEMWGFQLVSTDQLGNAYTCYIDGVRVTNGVSRYSGVTYTVPTTTFGNVPENGDAYWDDVTLLAHFDGENNYQGVLVDSSQYGNNPLTNGGARLSTDSQMFGPSSLFIDASGNVICFDQLGFSADFTIECWVRYSVSTFQPTNSYPIWSCGGAPMSIGVSVYAVSDTVGIAQIAIWDNNASPPNYNLVNYRSDASINLFSPQTWHAVAVQRRSGRIQMFVDGIMVLDFANTNTFSDTQNIQYIGTGASPSGGEVWQGYIDEFRLTRDVARYTDLVAPMGPFPLEVCVETLGLVKSVNVSGGNTGLTTTGGPVIDVGTITLSGILNIQSGGTGANNATGAINALLPAQSGQSGKFLTTDGTTVSWAAGGGGVTQILAGTNITISPTGGTGAVTISSSGAMGDGIGGSAFVPNNAFVTVEHNLGRIPIIMLWTLESDAGNIDQPGLYDVTINTFKVGASGSGGTVYFRYW